MKKSLVRRYRDLLSAETGTVFKDPGGKINICLVYPNTYSVGMSNLGFTGLYTLLNERDDVVCERAFLPDPEDILDFKKTGTPLVSLESGRPLTEFHVIGFSVSFENDYPNVVRILDLARMKPVAADRGTSGPLVIMGGPCSFMNPEPLAPFVDVVFVGEAEEMFHDFFEVLKQKNAREEILLFLAGHGGFYIPAFYEPVYDDAGMIASVRKRVDHIPGRIQRRFLKNLDSPVLRSAITTPKTEFKDMFLLEAMRGCPFSCRFCAAGHIYNPPRQRNSEILKGEIGRARERGLRVGLIAPSLSEYTDIEKVLSLEGVHFSITSLRASRRSGEILSLLKDKRSISIAPEAGTQRLRDVINKKVTEEDILTTVKLIFESDMRTLRLYFMIGLPTESDEDIQGIVTLTKNIRALSKKGNISLTLSNFVPKPFTPFQWHPMVEMEIVKKRITMIKKGLFSLKGVSIGHDVLKDSYMQGLFAMGDRRMSAVLLRMLGQKDWSKACGEAGIDPRFSIFRQKSFDEYLPWDFIDNGISKEKLWEEYRKAIV
ncbi:MAG: radical SAM protein [bacterium]